MPPRFGTPLAPASPLSVPAVLWLPALLVLGAPPSLDDGFSHVPTELHVWPLAQWESVTQSTHTSASPHSWSVSRQSLSDEQDLRQLPAKQAASSSQSVLFKHSTQ
jgi:hypothetical protein